MNSSLPDRRPGRRVRTLATVNRRTRLLLCLVSVPLLVSACGGDPDPIAATTSTTVPPPEATDTTTAAATDTTTAVGPLSGLPELDVVRLSSGATVPLASLTASGTPTLLWFWAPHCVFCRREAPEVVAFADRHAGEIAVLGLGAQDSLDEAYDFLGDTGTGDLEMVWDRTGRSWVHFDVTNQPTVVLLDGDGEVQGTWFRDFDEDAIVAAAAD